MAYMNAVIYARYSSSGQREESIEGQLRECKAFAEKNGFSVIKCYIDRALTATTDRRPEFQKMMKDCEKSKFDTIIVWKLDRFARNRYDSAIYKHKIKKHNIKVVSATEVISQGAEGVLLEAMLEGMAEYYSLELAEKVARGMTENALKCKFNGGTVPIGYIVNAEQYLEPNPLTAHFVVEAFKQYDEGHTCTEIKNYLNDKGLTNTRGGKISLNSVQHMLSNRRYIGEYAFQDIVISNGIPQIVATDLFERVQEKLAKNKKPLHVTRQRKTIC